MATGGSLFDGKNVDLAFSLLDSQDIDVHESLKTLIKENLDSTKESWLINSLVDYFYTTKSSRVVDILWRVQEPHDKFLLDRLHDGIKSREEQQVALELLLHLVSRQPSWMSKVVNQHVLKVVIKCLKSETNVPVLMTAVTIVTILLPSVPNLIGHYLPDIFEVFHRLATLCIKKPVGNTPDIFLLHLQISVYSLFHRLYGMFPYNFLTYLRHFYSKKENTQVFEEVIKNMLERVRLHPNMITGTKEHETSSQRWRQMETHDVIVECARMSLDPVEGTWEELKCPIVSSRYMSDRPVANLNQALPPVTTVTQAIGEVSPSIQSTADNMFWSPSEVIGLSTPPPSNRNTPAIPTLDIPSAAQYSQQSGAPQFTSIITPSNTPRETPPISEEHEKGASRTSSRYLTSTRVPDPKRLSSEFTTSGPVPLLTPSSIPQSVPPSPLKTEFTSDPPVGVKTLPVLYAARELQFDNDHSQADLNLTENKDNKNELKVVHSHLLKRIPETSSSKEGSRTPSRSNSTNKVEELPPPILDNQQQSTVNQDTVDVENLSKLINELETNDDDSDEEVSALTADKTITAESVAKFMRSVNRIRFNSLSNTKSLDITPMFGSKRSRSCPQLPKIDPMKEEEESISRSVSTTCNEQDLQASDLDPVNLNSEGINSQIMLKKKLVERNDSVSDYSILSTGSTVTVNLKQEAKISVETTPSRSNSDSKCPVYSSSSLTNSVQEESGKDSKITELFKQILNPLAVSPCETCSQAEKSTKEKEPMVQPYFSSFSPPELLDQHIRLGGEIHAKELSKLPMPSTQLVNWTHFGGAPPADEISILRGRLMLLHTQLLYERNKREQHAKRNRRLLRKIANTEILECQNRAMEDQIRQHEMQIRDLNVSLKLLESENRTLKSTNESEEYQKLVQLKSCLRENEILHCTKRDQIELLERQKEEQENLRKKLMMSEARLFTAEKELETMKTHSTMNVKLKEQIFQLQKELILKSELLQKNLTSKISKHPKQEFERTQKALKAELKEMRAQFEDKSKLLDSCLAQIDEKNKRLEDKEITLAELKLSLEKVKSSHDAEIKAVEDKHQSVLRINQVLESQILQLHTELGEIRSKLQSRGRAILSSKMESYDTSFGSSSLELTHSQTGSKSPLTRLGSSSSDFFENSQTILANLQACSPDYAMCLNDERPPVSNNFESSEQVIVIDDVESQLKNETFSLSSDSSAFRSLGLTDSEETRSTSARSSNLGDSGVG